MKKVWMLCIWITIFTGFFLVILRGGYKNILYEKLGYRNALIEKLLIDEEIGNDDSLIKNDIIEKLIYIDWCEKYPRNVVNEPTETIEDSKTEKLKLKIKNTESKIEWYYEKGFPFYEKLIEVATEYDELIGWDIQPFGKELILKNGYCIKPEDELDITRDAENLVKLNSKLKTKGCELMYVQAPSKICNETVLPLGFKDYSNENADSLLEKLAESKIDFLDLRKTLMTNESEWHKLFYKTDHHWKVETAFASTNAMCKYMSEMYHSKYDEKTFELSRYDIKNYDKIFLGSYGRKVTLSRVEPEDYAFIIPKYETNMHLYMPEYDIDTNGDFEQLFIDYSKLHVTNYYTGDAYGCYRTRRQYVTQIRNVNTNNKDKRILILRDSFANPVVPFLALQYGYVDSIEPATFDGSIMSYIEETNPDIVIVMYTTENLKFEQNGTFDFD